MTKIAKNIDQGRVSSEQKRRTAWLDNDAKLTNQVGYAGAPLEIPTPTLIESGIESIFPAPQQGNADQSNAQIVVTRDRPASIFSGYAGIGHQRCSTIDIVAGRHSAKSTTTIPVASDSDLSLSEQLAMVDPSFEKDAARIYISEKTDIDFNFQISIPEGNLSRGEEETTRGDRLVQDSVARSAIGLKADAIRIIGNEGVRIVTGVYEFNSRGGERTPGGIELVAENANDKPYDIQPFVKGKNMASALSELHEEVTKMNGLLEEFMLYQFNINQIVSKLRHNVGPKKEPTPPPALGSLPDEFKRLYDFSAKNMKKIRKKLDLQAQNLTRWEKVYLSPESYDWILSKYNGTN